MTSSVNHYDFEFLKYLNFARQHPAYYVSIIEKQIQEFIENGTQLPIAPNVYYETNEGKQAWIEARNFLLEQKSLLPFLHHPGLQMAAEVHVKDLCRSGNLDHVGSDHSTFNQRILRYCKKGPGAMSELIGSDFKFNGRNTPELTVLSLIIDDGVKDRGHRKTIFSNNYKYVGWSSGLQDEKIITVFNLTENNLPILGKQYPVPSIQTLPSHRLEIPKKISQASKKQIQVSKQSVQVTKQPFQASQKSLYSPQQPVQAPKQPVQTPKKSLQALNQSVQTPKQPFKDLTNHKEQVKTSKSNTMTQSETSSFWSNGSKSKNKHIQQKRQNSRIYYEDGCKVMETTTKYFYDDGCVEQTTEKRTLFQPEMNLTS